MENKEFKAKIDMHIHSCYSFDSLTRPSDIVKIAIKRGLEGIAITDHNTLRGSLAGKKYCRENGIDIMFVMGAEYETDKGDVLALFIEDEIKHKENIFELIDTIHENNGIAIKAHPFKRVPLEKDIIKIFDGLEAFNSRNPYNDIVRDIVADYKFPQTGGSDAHFLFEVGRGFTMVPKVSDEEELMKTILDKKSDSGGKSSPFIDIFSQGIKMIKYKKFNLFRLFQIGGMEAKTYVVRNKMIKKWK